MEICPQLSLSKASFLMTKYQKSSSLWWVRKVYVYFFFLITVVIPSASGGKSVCCLFRFVVFLWAKVVWWLFISSKCTGVSLNHFLRCARLFTNTHILFRDYRCPFQHFHSMNLLTIQCALALTIIKQAAAQFHLLLLKYCLV